jgi:Na+/melibiose symporter-like transporter
MVGLLLTLAVQGPFMSTDSACIIPDNDKNKTDITLSSSFNNVYNNNSYAINLEDEMMSDAYVLPAPAALSVWARNVYVFFALILTVVFLFGNYILVAFVKENPELIKASNSAKSNVEKLSTWTQLKRILTFKPYIILAFGAILNTSAVQVVQSNLELYFKYGYSAIQSYFALAILVLLVNIWKQLIKYFLD